MERINIIHQSRKGFNPEKYKKILYENLENPLDYGIFCFELDHIIPYSISMDNSMENLQLLKRREHQKKSRKDRKIIKLFRDKGWIEKETNYSHDLLKSINFLVEEYKKEFLKLSIENQS